MMGSQAKWCHPIREAIRLNNGLILIQWGKLKRLKQENASQSGCFVNTAKQLVPNQESGITGSLIIAIQPEKLLDKLKLITSN